MNKITLPQRWAKPKRVGRGGQIPGLSRETRPRGPAGLGAARSARARLARRGRFGEDRLSQERLSSPSPPRGAAAVGLRRAL